MKISLIQPSRNNLKYLKWSYDAIRKNQGNHTVEICVADDASSDGTWEWCQEIMGKDPYFKAILNDTGKRLGHTILYDRLINEVASHDVCMIYHADMYLCPGALDAIEDELKEKTIVSLTRIEPPLHPDGPEKILRDFGTEPEEFNEHGLLDFIKLRVPENNTTEGIFAPWAFWKSDFQEIGGHDPLYAPQSKEDSDIFNRFQLNGIKFIQTWHGCVYHMTCRGSRRNTVDGAPNIQTNNPEWEAQNLRSTRNFIRKWGHFVKHDPLMKPIIPPKYNVSLIVKNCNMDTLRLLEPWCDVIYIQDEMQVLTTHYMDEEQPNTKFNLAERIKPIEHSIPNENIQVYLDRTTFNQQDFNIIQQLPEILQDSGEIGEFELGNLQIKINSLETFEKDLIFINKQQP
jgi:glycosyltransferase involved in cell wall biosynthesis